MSSFTRDLVIKKIKVEVKKNRFFAFFSKNKYKKVDRWKVYKTFIYQIGHKGSNNLVVVPEGFITDGASIPRFLWVFVGHPFAEYAQAAVLHDFLYSRKYFPRKECDEIFREAMGVLGVVALKIMAMYQGVRKFGWIPWNRSIRRRKKMKKKVLSIIGLSIVLLALQGCALHFVNEKGIKADVFDIITQVGTVEEGNAYYWSRLEIWIPNGPKREGINVSTNSIIK